MIARNAEPISHRTPLPRIDLNLVRKAAAEDGGAGFSYSPTETARIWGLLRQSAEGCNATVPETE